jgi:hypothetical protein
VDGGTQSEHRAIGRVNTEFPGRAESREAYERESRGGDDAREGLRDRREVACAQLRGAERASPLKTVASERSFAIEKTRQNRFREGLKE